MSEKKPTPAERSRQTHRDMYEYHVKQVLYYLSQTNSYSDWMFTPDEVEAAKQKLIRMLGFVEDTSVAPETQKKES